MKKSLMFLGVWSFWTFLVVFLLVALTNYSKIIEYSILGITGIMGFVLWKTLRKDEINKGNTKQS